MRAFIVAAIVAMFCSAGLADEPFWPQFHGPNRDSHSTETGLPKQWPTDGPRLIWHSTGNPISQGNIAIVDGRIFLAGSVGRDEFVAALDLNGKPLWRAPNGAESGRASSTSSTPTYFKGRVYHIGAAGRLAAFDAQTGREAWSVDLVKQFGARYGMYGIAESVSADGDQVICTPGGPRGLMVGLDRNTGATRWAVSQPDDDAAYCTPLLVTWKGVRQAITVTKQFIISVDINAGKLLWAQPFKTGHGENAVTPVFHDGQIFVTTSHETGSVLLKINDDQAGVSQVWANKEFGTCHGGVVLVGQNIYGSACKGQKRALFCMDFKTGAIKQTDKSIYWGSPFFADGLLYCRSADGWLCLLEPTAEGFRVISRFRQANNSGCFVHPVVCGGRLYVRFRSQLWAYDVRSPGGPTTSSPSHLNL